MVLALLLTMEEVLREVQDVLRSRRKLRLQQKWADCRLHDDLHCSHPMWPQVEHTFRNLEVSVEMCLDQNMFLFFCVCRRDTSCWIRTNKFTG